METREELLAKNKRMKATRCRHFTGCQNDKCKAGKVYREVVGGPELGWAARLPCLPESEIRKEPMATCSSYEPKSTEDLAREERELTDGGELLVMAIQIIRATKLNRGVIACPKCYTGDLGFSVAKTNGHVWGRCSKAGCLAWMM